MKKDSHPTYYKKAKVSCACGNKFIIGSTKEKIAIEICSKCNPFNTGKKQLIDTAGRAEKFHKRRELAKNITKKQTSKKTQDNKKKQKPQRKKVDKKNT